MADAGSVIMPNNTTGWECAYRVDQVVTTIAVPAGPTLALPDGRVMRLQEITLIDRPLEDLPAGRWVIARGKAVRRDGNDGVREVRRGWFGDPQESLPDEVWLLVESCRPGWWPWPQRGSTIHAERL